MAHIRVEVAYARPDCQRIVELSVPEGTSVGEAIRLSGILVIFPEIDLSVQKTGIFSQPVSLDTLLKADDRVEIYRPLAVDPKEARRRRAASVRQGK